MRRAQENLGDTVLFLADFFHIVAGEDGEINGDKGKAFTVDFQHQAAGVHWIMERLIGHRRDTDLRRPGEKLSRHAIHFIREMKQAAEDKNCGNGFYYFHNCRFSGSWTVRFYELG